jgi:hypothetical protein
MYSYSLWGKNYKKIPICSESISHNLKNNDELLRLLVTILIAAKNHTKN